LVPFPPAGNQIRLSALVPTPRAEIEWFACGTSTQRGPGSSFESLVKSPIKKFSGSRLPVENKNPMAKKKLETLFLVCEETGDHNYTIRRKPGGEKLRLKKYSPRLRRHTVHTEKKK
jgi:large subunit ribosomal protein L33